MFGVSTVMWLVTALTQPFRRLGTARHPCAPVTVSMFSESKTGNCTGHLPKATGATLQNYWIRYDTPPNTRMEPTRPES